MTSFRSSLHLSSCLLSIRAIVDINRVPHLDHTPLATIGTTRCTTIALTPDLARLPADAPRMVVVTVRVRNSKDKSSLSAELLLILILRLKDLRRSPPRGPAADRRRDYSGDLDSRPRYRSRDRDDYRRRPSRSPPPRRGRPVYRDRDREGYRSPEYDSRSRSYSRNRSHRQGRQPYGQESREVMMDGLPVEMVEEDVGQLLP